MGPDRDGATKRQVYNNLHLWIPASFNADIFLLIIYIVIILYRYGIE